MAMTFQGMIFLGDGLSIFIHPKKKSRDFIAASAESLSLSRLLLCRPAPILHLRREWKPIAAKWAEVAKSSHKRIIEPLPLTG
jgi:hypothetical protein